MVTQPAQAAWPNCGAPAALDCRDGDGIAIQDAFHADRAFFATANSLDGA